MAKKKSRKFYRTVVQVEVLSEEPFQEGMSLYDLASAIDDGGYSGWITLPVQDEVHNGKEMAKLLKKQGSDPEFFNLDSDGNDLED